MKGNIVNIDFLTPGGGVFLDEIIDVGEGIVIGRLFDMSFTEIYSTCAITRITPINQQQINSSRTSNSLYFNRNSSPPAI
ncbi:hypothetical protein [Chengkuizengella marina]|uniref:Uncharacterized protein n=1 Tax=Chengkuizengella marina TaxID=2507566 RepID=A0A6N9Q8K3_9BACL|nr:hypothetical protein [Chengkuizengella marina]NBI31216.1 hypothetical protein [Chengkuizengella marina]